MLLALFLMGREIRVSEASQIGSAGCRVGLHLKVPKTDVYPYKMLADDSKHTLLIIPGCATRQRLIQAFGIPIKKLPGYVTVAGSSENHHLCW